MARKTVQIVGSAKMAVKGSSASPGLMRALESKGFTSENFTSADLLISINHNEQLYREFIRGGGSSSRAVLVRLEPKSVFPLQYLKPISRKYDLIITPGAVDDFTRGENFVGWPYQYNLNPTSPSLSDPLLSSIMQDPLRANLFTLEDWRSRPKAMVMIAANKVSPIRSSNYSLRRKLAASLPPDLLEVYGPLWIDNLKVKARHRVAVALVNLRQGVVPNLSAVYGELFSHYPGAKGAIPDKHTVTRKARFSLVIENSNTYVSEKLLDAAFGGSIPIYIGPRLEDVGLPTNLAIQSSGDPHEIAHIVQNLDDAKVVEMLTSIGDFFEGPTFRESWSEQGVYSKISQQISDFYDGIDT